MNDKKIEELIDVLYPYFERRMLKDGFLKNCVRCKNAIVYLANESSLSVRLPYDDINNRFIVPNKTGEIPKVGDTVCLFYWIDIKNAVAMFKVIDKTNEEE